MTLSARLWREAQPAALRCREHPFVRGLEDGTLDARRYREFIAQDAFFLEAFARGYAHCLARSPDRAGVYEFHRLLNGVFEELELHRSAACALDIDLAAVEPAPATLAYTRFLEEAVAEGATVGETLAAMTPCMRLYAYLGAELAGGERSANPYREWIAAYAGEQSQQLASLIESLLDRYGAGTAAERGRYMRALELEHGFFDAAWRGAGDDS